MRVAVAGGTGTVGRHVVAALRRDGHEAVVLARSVGVDLVAGTGVDDALDGAGAVVDVSNTRAMRRSSAVAFFEAVTRNLLDAGRRAGLAHYVVLSIVGIDRVRIGYYQGKQRQEQLALSSGQPVSVLRATQFHEFVGQALARIPGPVALLPRFRTQPVAAAEVGDALARLAAGAPVGDAGELGGPEPRELADLARLLLRKRGSRRPVLRVPVPGAAGRAMSGGALLPGPAAVLGTQTFEQWLAGTPEP